MKFKTMDLAVFTVLILLESMTEVTLGQDTHELVIFMTDHGLPNFPGIIYKVNIHKMNFESLPLTNVHGPMAIDYDMKGEQIYWTDTITKQIRTATKDGENDTVVVQLNETSSPEGLTLDSNTRQVFYTDKGEDVIVRIEMDTFESTVIVDTGLDHPKGIVADTKNRKLYWVDRGSAEKIESCDYDGGQRRTVVKIGVITPNGITLEQKTGRLYWADGIGHVESILTDGTDRRMVYTRIGVPFNDVFVFNSFLFLTLLNYPYLVAMPEDGSQNIVLHSRHFQTPYGLRAYSPNFNVSRICSNGQFGANCETCGNCYDGDFCEKTTGTCLGGCQPGFQGYKCKEVCDSGTYGEDCDLECTNCTVGTVCDHITGTCPSGCQWGYKGDKCDEVCGPNTYGNPCEECGACAGGQKCHEVTGACPQGCLNGLEEPLCKEQIQSSTVQTSTEGASNRTVGDTGHSVGLVVGIAVGVTLVVIAVVIVAAFFFIRRQRKLREPGTYVEMDRPETKEHEYATTDLGFVSNTGIMQLSSDELGQQTTQPDYSVS